MRRGAPRALAAAGALLITATACTDDGPQSPRTAALGVVRIETWRCDEPNRFTGYGINVDGRIVTAAHLVDGRLRELLVEGEPATVASIDERTDLATLRVAGSDPGSIRASVSDLAPRPVQPARDLPVAVPGDEVWLIAGAGPTGPQEDDDEAIRAIPVDVVRETRLVVINVSTRTRVERNAIVFGPGVDEGTSGAPLVNTAGELIGVVVLASRSGERAYAVRADEVRAVAARSPQVHLAEPATDTGSSAGACDRW